MTSSTSTPSTSTVTNGNGGKSLLRANQARLDDILGDGTANSWEKQGRKMITTILRAFRQRRIKGNIKDL